MRYVVNVENKNYIIDVKKAEAEKYDDVKNRKSEGMSLDSGKGEEAYDICLAAVVAEYEHETVRANKLDNKVYILLTVCAFVFNALYNFIEKIPKVKEINADWSPKSWFWQVHYASAVYVTSFFFVVTLIILIILLSNIKMKRLDGTIVLEKNLVELPKRVVAKFLCSKYCKATQDNRENSKSRYILFNVCVITLMLSIIALITLGFISNVVTFKK